mmetsp:Transcript_67538/g.119884  ORF Transcript_67538/g.119884 Transcript_67538/m.119884 type:complete len:745 (-) Transcript_67538:259-2493(-)
MAAFREALAARASRLDDKVEATLNAAPAPPIGAPGPMARAENQVAATLDAVPLARKRQTKEAGTAQLARCRVLIEAVDYAVKVISGAGSRLERGAVKFGEATVLQQRQSRIKEGAPAGRSDIQIMHASLGLIDATGSMGATLAQLGTMLNSEILVPLQSLYAQIEHDQERRHAGLMVLQQQEQLCGNALAESAKRKERACQLLQVALKEVEEGSNVSKTSWLKKSIFSKKDKTEQLAQQQTAAVEELALRTEEANMARLRRQEGADAFHSMCCEVDGLYKQLLQTILSRCSHFWKDASKALTGMSDQLQTGASALGLNIAGGGGHAKSEKSDELGEAEKEQEIAGDTAGIAPPAAAMHTNGKSIDMPVSAAERPVVAATATPEASARYDTLAEDDALRTIVGKTAAQHDFQTGPSPVDSAAVVDAVATVAPAATVNTSISEEVAVGNGSSDGPTTVVDEEVQALLSSIPDAESEMSAPIATTTAGTAKKSDAKPFAHMLHGGQDGEYRRDPETGKWIPLGATASMVARDRENHAAISGAPVARATENGNALASINAADVIVSAEFTATRQADEGAAAGFPANGATVAAAATASGPADEFYDSCDADVAGAEAAVELQIQEAVLGASSTSSAPAPTAAAAAEDMSPAAVDASPKRLNRLLNVIVEESQGPLGMKLMWPPGPVEVQEVIPGGWAFKSGVQAGSELVLLDGLPVAEMDEAALRLALQVRPLCLAVRLPPADELPDRV